MATIELSLCYNLLLIWRKVKSSEGSVEHVVDARSSDFLYCIKEGLCAERQVITEPGDMKKVPLDVSVGVKS